MSQTPNGSENANHGHGHYVSEDGERLTLNGLLCSACGEPQFTVVGSGDSCGNGHGGAPGIAPDRSAPEVQKIFEAVDAPKVKALQPPPPKAIEQVLVATETQLRRKARMALKSGYLPSTIYTEDQVLTIVRAGEELGLPFMSSLRSIHLIEGKIGLDSTLMRALVFRKIQGARIDFIECSADRCLVEMQRPGGKTNVFAFTVEDARRAGLLKKTNWMKYPISMLIARASTIGIRAIFPDAIFGSFGIAYELDELDDRDPISTAEFPDRNIDVEKLRADIMALANRLPDEKKFACLDQTNKAASKYNVELLQKILARTKEIVESNQPSQSQAAPSVSEENQGNKEDEGIGSVSNSSNSSSHSDSDNGATTSASHSEG